MNYMDGWVSPVELIYENAKNEFLKQTDEFIMARCESALGVKVDKDELIKALHYDREQYKKGFANGYEQRENEIVRCKDCKHWADFAPTLKILTGYDGQCKKYNRDVVMNLTDYCSYGERRESE